MNYLRIGISKRYRSLVRYTENMETVEKKSFKTKRSMKENDISYKEQFEILNEKYAKIKDILKQVLKDLKEEKEKQQLLIAEYEKLALEVKDKDTLLERMQSVSEAVIDEYSALKVKCDLEAEAATNASKRATKYFQENQELKRNTQHELDVQICDSNKLPCQESNLEENVSELDMLNSLASDLRTEIGSLKIQLSKEIEKQKSLKEDFKIAKDLYEQEMKEHNYTREILQSLQQNSTNHVMASCQFEKSDNCIAQTIVYHKKDQDNISMDFSNSIAPEAVGNSDTFVAKLEMAKQQVTSYKHKNNVLNIRVQELEFENRKLRAEASASEFFPLQPPPPPPPLPPPSFNPIKSLITFIHAGKKSTKIKKESAENPHQKAMSEMINAIKKGQVLLKPTPKTLPQSPGPEESALGEMKNILSTLKKKRHTCTEDIKVTTSEALLSTDHSSECSVQEADENFNFGVDIDDELKILLRNRSLKSISNQNMCVMSFVETKSTDANDALTENQAECHVSPFCDSVITSENQRLSDIHVPENAMLSPEI